MDVREKLVELLNKANSACVGTDCFEGCKFYMENDCLYKLMADVMIENGVTVQEWISVNDRLPPYNQAVLVYRPNMAMKILVDEYAGYYGDDDEEWNEGWVRYGKDIHNNQLITHWAHLPQPPKGE